jgi:hypothetical protein
MDDADDEYKLQNFDDLVGTRNTRSGANVSQDNIESPPKKVN